MVWSQGEASGLVTTSSREREDVVWAIDRTPVYRMSVRSEVAVHVSSMALASGTAIRSWFAPRSPCGDAGKTDDCAA
jgi:hypothetical protein